MYPRQSLPGKLHTFSSPHKQDQTYGGVITIEALTLCVDVACNHRAWLPLFPVCCPFQKRYPSSWCEGPRLNLVCRCFVSFSIPFRSTFCFFQRSVSFNVSFRFVSFDILFRSTFPFFQCVVSFGMSFSSTISFVRRFISFDTSFNDFVSYFVHHFILHFFFYFFFRGISFFVSSPSCGRFSESFERRRRKRGRHRRGPRLRRRIKNSAIRTTIRTLFRWQSCSRRVQYLLEVRCSRSWAIVALLYYFPVFVLSTGSFYCCYFIYSMASLIAGHSYWLHCSILPFFCFVSLVFTMSLM